MNYRQLSDAILVMFVTHVVVNFYIFDWFSIIPFSLTIPVSLIVGAVVGYIAVYRLKIRAVLAERISLIDTHP